ncbi:hypothetical protein BD289DRAFT_156054 [Coniella lustricola]|uniref:Uncharacterized protein n=1 Tax=Coniella lustricola TaxID=2025994 RepID=A0A2T3AMR9_9PEZI|nr:hypothetical protein BD289DRAFT_156054 [Coniella lustricola]
MCRNQYGKSSLPAVRHGCGRARDRNGVVRVRFPSHIAGAVDTNVLVLDNGTRGQIDSPSPQRIAGCVGRGAQGDGVSCGPVPEGGNVAGAAFLFSNVIWSRFDLRDRQMREGSFGLSDVLSAEFEGSGPAYMRGWRRAGVRTGEKDGQSSRDARK